MERFDEREMTQKLLCCWYYSFLFFFISFVFVLICFGSLVWTAKIVKGWRENRFIAHVDVSMRMRKRSDMYA